MGYYEEDEVKGEDLYNDIQDTTDNIKDSLHRTKNNIDKARDTADKIKEMREKLKNAQSGMDNENKTDNLSNHKTEATNPQKNPSNAESKSGLGNEITGNAKQLSLGDVKVPGSTGGGMPDVSSIGSGAKSATSATTGAASAGATAGAEAGASAAAGAASAAAGAAGTAAGSGGGAAAGAVAGSVVPGIGTAIGAAAGKVAGDTIGKGVKLVQELKDEAKKAPKEARSNRKIDKNEYFSGASKKIVIIIMVIFLPLAAIGGSIAALNPINMINLIGNKLMATVEAIGDDFNDIKNNDGSILQWVADLCFDVTKGFVQMTKAIGGFFDGADEDTLAMFDPAKDYETSMASYKEALTKYMGDALELKRTRLPEYLKYTDENGKEYEIDYNLTMANFSAQGNPFAYANYAALLAAYAVYDYEKKDSTLSKFQEALKNGEDNMLQVNYTYTDENGSVNTQRVVTPRPVYNYTEIKTMAGRQMYEGYLFTWQEACPDGCEAIQKAYLEDLNTQKTNKEDEVKKTQDSLNISYRRLNNISSQKGYVSQATIDKKREEEKADLERAQKMYDDLDDNTRNLVIVTTGKTYEETYKETLDQAQKDYDKWKNMTSPSAKIEKQIEEKEATIKTLNSEISNLETLISKVEKDESLASYDKINFDNLCEGHQITIYAPTVDEVGSPDILFMVESEEGRIADEYLDIVHNAEQFTFEKIGTQTFDGGYYIKTGNETMVYPIVEDKHYADVSMQIYDTTNALAVFGVDPDAIYPLSEGKGKTPVTNREMYNAYYDVIVAENKLGNGMDVNLGGINGHSCTLSVAQIESYLELAKTTCPSVSKNRLQFIKTALGLTGAIPYQMNGKPTNPGWNEDWWKPVADGYMGLDCSGFVEWAAWTAWDYRELSGGTSGISSNCHVISESDLKPGDLGLKFIGGSNLTTKVYNHVGIYIGKDSEGNNLWVHCASGEKSNTVVINNYSGFKIFVRPPYTELEMDTRWTDETISYGNNMADSDQLYVIAKCMLAESGDDVGFQACVEATLNCCLFYGPSTCEALYQKCLEPSYLVHRSYKEGGKTHYVNQYDAIFVLKEKEIEEPQQKHYDIITNAIAGQRTYILDPRVAYWRSHDIKSLSGYTFYGTFPETGPNYAKNNFFYQN